MSSEHLSALPEGMTRDSAWIYEAAEFTAKIQEEHRQAMRARETQGAPWGDVNLEGDSFAKDYDKVFPDLEEAFSLYLSYLAQVTEQAADRLWETGRNLDTTEDENVHVADSGSPDANRGADGSGGRR
ncbi:hypothetical protein [Nocardiopsis sp. CNT312]|uniref:hypothetical protein n=1 Tax=Nocardiopsis sp. CNT312 TaxID=1137268 RepID=UPI000490540A|nr:hypothetical protein [Nocardiopsis sp. CNT312]